MRLDVYLVENGLAKSRSYAKQLIEGSLVSVDGKTVKKPSFEVIGENVSVNGELYPFVGRGGVKLERALDEFRLDVAGAVCLDIGASTGGFTDCLLKRGASKVYAVDSGHGQLDPLLLSDDRVVNIEGFNAKELNGEVIPDVCDIAVCDVSFISQTQIIGAMCPLLKQGGRFVTLIKPQFECGRQALGKGGIVKDRKFHYEASMKVACCASEHGLSFLSIIRSPIEGGDGNTEFLAHFIKGGDTSVNERIIKEVTLCKNT